MNGWVRRITIATVAIIIGGVGWYVVQKFKHSKPEDIITVAQRQFDGGDPIDAVKIVDDGIAQHPNNVALRRLAATIAAKCEDAAAETTHREWLRNNTPGDTDNLYQFARLNSQLNSMNLTLAEELLSDVLRADATHSLARDLLIRVLNQQGRRWETLPHLQWQLEHDAFTLDTLMLMGNLSAALPIRETLMTKCANDELDLPATLGVARIQFAKGNTDRAKALLTRIIEQYPDLTEAQVRLAEILQLQQPGQFERWDNEHAPQFDDHPQLWFIRGRHATQRGDQKRAIGCFIRACELNPTFREALFPLSQALLHAGKKDEAERLTEHNRKLTELATMVSNLFEQGPARAEMERCAELTLELGRVTEAFAWSRIVLANSPDSRKASAVAVKAAEVESSALLPGRISNELARAYRIAGPVKWEIQSTSVASETASPPTDRIAFEAEPPTVFPEFQYFNGADAQTQERRMFEFTGGGVAAIDVDNDHWPDVFFAQGQRWEDTDAQLRDQLLRNHRGINFSNVTLDAMPSEMGFGQGVAVSDINDDGFDDLMVCNIGQNQLLRSNGDGTYSDVTPFPQQQTRIWSSSAAFGDFDADGDEDLFVGNFLGGNDVYTRICGDDGAPRSCPPANFPGEPDSVWQNLGDGTWKNVSQQSGIVKEHSNSLGVLVADFTQNGRQSIFVANDSVPNFYFENNSGPEIRFEEQGSKVGLSLNQTGNAQACMGIAAGDFDGNELLDLCITNFHNEPNAAYLQIVNGVFVDSTRETGLYDSSIDLLGFGTQAIDADLDGWQDIFVTNGHVDDFSEEQIPFRMPPMCLRNDGNRFHRIKPQDERSFFHSQKLGRGLCRLDWNQDGREDVCISHLLSPGALVTNKTATANSHCAIRLIRGRKVRTTTSTQLNLNLAGRNLYRQAVSGDGYMAANEDRFVFGGISDRAVSVLKIRWPNRTSEEFKLPAIGQEFAVVEGRGFYRLPR